MLESPHHGKEDNYVSVQDKGRFCFKYAPYLNNEAQDNLKRYKYAGGDNGIAYKLFFNPFALWLVDRIPVWIAPNLLTLIGFMFTLIPFIILFKDYGLNFEQEGVPSQMYFAMGVSYFIYRMLDEMDGKQARKTGNSSPLGMLFDHGCDAFSVGFILMFMAKVMGFGSNLRTLIWI
jgi:ethanolaminephosphotransferase